MLVSIAVAPDDSFLAISQTGGKGKITLPQWAEECRCVAGVDPTDPAVVEAHARAVQFMPLDSSPPRPHNEPTVLLRVRP